MSTSRAWDIALSGAAAALFSLGCGGGGDTGGSGASGSTSAVGVTSGAGSSTTSPTGSTGTGAAPCATDPLKTGLVAQQTGVSVDAFDCEILTASTKYGMPDPMIVKAIIYVESRFDQTSVGCPNAPCMIPSGWTASEAGCLGLMQVVPACGGVPNGEGLLPNGHPNMTTDMAAAGWAGSIFNPSINVDLGVSGIVDNRAQEKAKFSGCTDDQYTMMAIGDYNSYGSTKSCTQYNSQYDDVVLMAYKEYAAAAGYPAHPY